MAALVFLLRTCLPVLILFGTLPAYAQLLPDSLSQDSARMTLRDSFNLPAPEAPARKTLKLWATQYYIHQFQAGGSIPFLLADGTPTGITADTCDFCTAALEGTAWIRDSLGQVYVLNYAARADTAVVNCRLCPRFAPSKLAVESWGTVVWKYSEGFGEGVKGYHLVPFRTIAVDSQQIPYGSVIYIPAARGMPILLPDGTSLLHDGYFFAGDTGGAIRGNHIDVFTGIYEGNPFPEVVYSRADHTFTARIITDPAIVARLTALHQP